MATVFPLLLMVVLLIVLPCYLTYAVWRGRDETRAMWWLKAAYSGACVIFFFLTGRWDLVSYYLRFVMVGLFLVAAFAGYSRARRLPWSIDGRTGPRMTIASGLFTLAAFIVLIGLAARGRVSSDDRVSLSFPLRDGVFYVGQGGNSPLVNYHNVNPAQRYALDIVQLNAVGARASGLYSSDLQRYVIFDTSVHSPCDGTVLAVAADRSDNVPPQTDRSHPAGNHVVIGCRGVRVVLAHLRKGTVQVQPGAGVATGTTLGKVGNSGNTSEPHLHVHAVSDDTGVMTGEGVPIVFDDVFPVRNTLLRR